MAIKFLEAGSDATFDMKFWTNTFGGGVSSDSGTVHTGPRSIKLASGASVVKDAVLADAGRRISFWLNFSSLVSDFIMDVRQVSEGSIVFDLESATAGAFLKLVPAGTAGSTGATTLVTGQWYRIVVCYTITSSTVNEFRVYLNGSLEISISNASMSLTGSSDLQFLGSPVGGWFFDDIYVDDDTSLSDPGDIRVTAKLPAANNTNNFNTAIGANPANRWTNVNERPLSETNGWEDTTAVGDQENYGLQAAATGDVDVSAATLVGRCAWIWAKVDTASVLSKIMDNGSESAITLTTSSALYTLLTTSASYPSNAAGVGIRSSTTPNTFLYECGTLIAYTPSSGPTVAQMTPAWEQLTDGGGLFAKRYV